jgi:hypothetical protein
MIFALERNALALRLLRLEKNAAGYQIAYQDQQLLTNKARAGVVASDGHLIQSLQQMRSQLPASAEVIIGIHDTDLVLECVRFEKSQEMQSIVDQSQRVLHKRLPQAIHHYSWDIHLSYQDAVCYGLCVAYPLQKIAFLQDLCDLSDLQLQVIEPSVCALARFCAQSLHLTQALLLLYENNHYTLFLAFNGEVIALQQFQGGQMLDEHYERFARDPLLTTQMEKISVILLGQEMSHYPQELFINKKCLPLQEVPQGAWATCMGLMMRQYAA